MALQSMTGFARTQGESDWGATPGKWFWEIRSVNSRSLDMRFRLPPGMDTLEPELRKRIGARFSRGNFQTTLSLERGQADAVPVVNEPALKAVLAALDALRQRLNSPPPAAETILTIRGVLESGDNTASPEERKRMDEDLLASFDRALVDLVATRVAEGTAIQPVIREQVDAIGALTDRIANDPSRQPDAIRQRLAKQLAPLLDEASALDPQRLYQEAALLATKADISEEIDRLRAHVESARTILASKDPVGRKLDFLAQEFNRECNTICSKSIAAAVTEAGLEMKLVIDRLREQVQNLE